MQNRSWELDNYIALNQFDQREGEYTHTHNTTFSLTDRQTHTPERNNTVIQNKTNACISLQFGLDVKQKLNWHDARSDWQETA